MGKTIVGTINDFYVGETVEITVLCKMDGVAQDITSDTVTLMFKDNVGDSDAEAALNEDADVATYGSAGVAYWKLAPAETDITIDTYHVDIVWYTGTDEYVIYNGSIRVKERISDI